MGRDGADVGEGHQRSGRLTRCVVSLSYLFHTAIDQLETPSKLNTPTHTMFPLTEPTLCGDKAKGWHQSQAQMMKRGAQLQGVGCHHDEDGPMTRQETFHMWADECERR